ncbi:MAG TPA: exo-beta-N-acetylmuramidase NamZ domain-containing protein, partial [Polyangiales bacterium]
MSARVASGLDRVSAGDDEALRLLRGRRLGLLAHAASVDAGLRHIEPCLAAAGAEVVALFGPEHGYTGHAQDMKAVADDARPALPVYSLYGDSFEALSPRPEWLEGLDAVVIDLQDVGSRYYTFVWSAALMLRACAQQGVPCVVLDRPNPLGGARLEGRTQRAGYRSFVGLYDVPVRHGLTIAEVLRMVQALEGIDPQLLQLVRMRGYTRDMLFADTG